MFDEAHFVISLNEACPQMQVHGNMTSLTHFDTPPNFKFEAISRYMDEAAENRLIARPEEWRATFDEWLSVNAPGFSAEKPILVWPGISLFGMPFSVRT